MFGNWQVLENRKVWVIAPNDQNGGAGREASAMDGSRKRRLEDEGGPRGKKVRTSQ